MSVMPIQEMNSIESEIKIMIRSEISNSQASSYTTASNNTKTITSSHLGNRKDKATSLLNFFLDTLSSDDANQNKKSSTSISKQITDEMKRYRKLAMQFMSLSSENHNPLEFWKQNQEGLPYLTPLAKKYLSTPATSVKSESAFSISGYYGRKQRAQLSSANLSFSVFLKDKLKNETFQTNL